MSISSFQQSIFLVFNIFDDEYEGYEEYIGCFDSLDKIIPELYLGLPHLKQCSELVLESNSRISIWYENSKGKKVRDSTSYFKIVEINETNINIMNKI